MRIKQSLLLSCVLMAASGVASAQAPPAPATPPAQTAPPAAATRHRLRADAIDAAGQYRAARAPRPARRAEPLGDKLAKSDGVLCPPAGVDPGNARADARTGNTPVIPPPGSPGGDPTIRPK